MTDVEKLKGIIEEIDVLISHNVKFSTPEFKIWQGKTKRFLGNKYGSESLELQEFNKMRFQVIAPIQIPDYRNIEKCKQDLIISKGIFQNYLSELSEESVDTDEIFDSEKELERIFTRFREVAVKLARRYDGRETLRITDEYDVQDLSWIWT